MATVSGSQIVEKAKSYKGKYAKHNNKFTKHFAGRYHVKKNGYYKNGYCTLFVLYVYDKLGILSWFPKKSDNTNTIYKYLKSKGKIIKDPAKAKMGQPAFKKVGSTKKKSSGHTSIFWKYENGYVYTIDGNVSGGVVVRKKKPNWYLGFGDILKTSTPAPTPKPQPTPAPVKTTTYYVNTDTGNLNLRDKPNTDKSTVKKTLARGTKVEVSTIKDGWAYLPSYKLYCSSKYLSTSKPPDKKKVLQKAYHPMANRTISCGWNDGAAHKKCSSSSANYRDYPTDLVGKDTGRDWALAPCDMIVLRRYTKASHSIWLRSVEEVQTPYGVGYLYMMSEHQDNKEMGEVGHVYKQGTKMFREGSNGNATGNHLHVSFGFSKTKQTAKTMGTGWVKNSKGAWVLHIPKVTNIKIDQAVYV